MLQAGHGLCPADAGRARKVTLDDAAVNVMTDLTRVTAVIILPGDTVDEAHRRMIQRGVRLLLVVDQDRKVVGLITATDILGEKPVLAASERGLRREEVLVRDIMTPQERLEVLGMADVRAAKVGHIVATLKKAGRQHAMVVERDTKGRQVGAWTVLRHPDRAPTRRGDPDQRSGPHFFRNRIDAGTVSRRWRAC